MLSLKEETGSISTKVIAESSEEFSIISESTIRITLRSLMTFSTLIPTPSIFSLVKMLLLISGMVHSKELTSNLVLDHTEKLLFLLCLLFMTRVKKKKLKFLQLIRNPLFSNQSPLKLLQLMPKLLIRSTFLVLLNTLFISGTEEIYSLLNSLISRLLRDNNQLLVLQNVMTTPVLLLVMVLFPSNTLTTLKEIPLLSFSHHTMIMEMKKLNLPPLPLTLSSIKVNGIGFTLLIAKLYHKSAFTLCWKVVKSNILSKSVASVTLKPTT